MSNFRRSVSLAAAGMALGAAFPYSTFGQAAPAQTFTWPGQHEGPISLKFSQASVIFFSHAGEAALYVPQAADDANPPSETTSQSDDTSHGAIQQLGHVKITTTHRSHGGHLTVDVEVVAYDSYTDTALGKTLGTQRSTGILHFEVSPCPEVDGVAGGNISVQLRQETTYPDGSLSNATSLAEGPFRFVNGDDAYRVRTEMDFQLSGGSLHVAPGASSSDPVAWAGAGPRTYSWGSSRPVNVDLGNAAWSWAGDVPAESANESPAADLALSTVYSVEKEVEKFWRSGNCIKLKPSEKDRKVDPQEKIELTVESEQRFDQKEVKAPIKAELTGVKSLDPTDKPVDEPAKFDFVAGEKRDDWGKIQLTQTGKRGIGRESVTFTVKPTALALSCDASFTLRGMGNRFDGHLQILDAQLKFQEDGTYRGTGNMKVTGPFTSGDDKCHADINYMNPVALLAKVDPKDASIVRVQITPTYVNYTTTCTPGPKENAGAWRRSTKKFNPYLALDFWGRMMANRKLTLFNPTTFNDSLAQGAQTKTSTTLTMTYSDGLKP